eukprot:TRINITY_DN80406_c0_g1_i1.p1 TRINITY_DN80406_c0_g1~~TRINITY_DN80406_c0_g1_i1.p1  ORF type:complete len:371 (-),score=51.45 TRINITY_DN80406_c0_g1_i1:113-1183(-)
MARPIFVSLLALVIPGRSDEPKTDLSGDTAAWYEMFAAGAPELLAKGKGLKWTEGPVWTPEGLLFSDTITGTIWRWREDTKSIEKFLTAAGGCPQTRDDDGANWSCSADQAEPGSNGMAMLGDGRVAICQHGARRLGVLDMKTRKISELASRFEGKRLNGPNDVVRHASGALIFTDPFYGLLETSRFYDHNYTQEKSEQGVAGIYVLSAAGELKLLDASTSRPNGLALLQGKPQQLVVAECCQGHSERCKQGLARWKIFELSEGLDSMQLSYVIERAAAETYAGCADGLKVHARTGLVISSCPQGICVLDLDRKRVTVKLHVGLKISNVAFGGGFLWITGEERLWRIPLAGDAREL